MTPQFAQLSALLAQLAAREQTVNLFFRDDDVADDEPALRRLLDLFARYAVPLNLAIIPGRLTEAGTKLLREYLKAHPGLFELNQHGWMHVNHETTGRKCEFGPGRSEAEQSADIARGRQILIDAFGADFSMVFVPPWNRCSDATLRALAQSGFEALSQLKGKTAVTGHTFIELSVTLDLHRWKGGVTLRNPDEIVTELVNQISAGELIGVMLHHQVMDETAFSFLARLLDELRNQSCVRFHTFQSLLKQLKNSHE
ncbi:MAG TPA: polysaccharide deacetylase family protein [Blastocatellia bacterium]|nr:polysaccharide deacetylase family protein [Blastocatellia bacterium]